MKKINRHHGHGIIAVLLFVFASTIAFPLPAVAEWSGGHDAMGSTVTSRTWYFAEGTTRAGFTEWLCLFNPGGEPTNAVCSYMLGTGQNIEKTYGLPPESRTTLYVSTEVPPENDVSMVVTSEDPIVAERPIYFTYKGAWSGGHVVGATSPGETWYFAEGSTRDNFETYLCLQNPSDEDAILNIFYYCADGNDEIKTGVVVARKSRFTIPVHEGELGIGRHNTAHGDSSIKVESTNGVPVVAERSMYFAYKGAWPGGHDVVGATEPRGTWYFAEGCTRDGFDTYICLENPSDRDTTANVYYYCADGNDEARTGITLSAQSRFTIPVHEVGLGIGRHNNSHSDFSIKVESADGVPIVAERSMYFSYRPSWTGGHDVVGATKPADLWYFAEGCTRDGFETYLCLENPDVRDTTVNVYYYCADGRNEERKAINVPAQRRLTIPVHETAFGIGRHNSAHGDFSIRVESTGNVPIVAERSVYFSSPWRTVDRASLAAAWGWGEVSRANTSKRCIALTLDIESSGGLANAVLDILKQKGVHSTLFVTGGFPGTYPGVVQRMAAEGHEIANHSMSHAMFTKASEAQLVSELAATEAAVRQATGYSTKPYFRFPYGDRNGALVRRANAEGYLSVYWTIDPQEWRSGATAAGVRATVVSQACNGAIVLIHDRARTVEALPGIIDDLRARGYTLVTLTEALYPGP